MTLCPNLIWEVQDQVDEEEENGKMQVWGKMQTKVVLHIAMLTAALNKPLEEFVWQIIFRIFIEVFKKIYHEIYPVQTYISVIFSKFTE